MKKNLALLFLAVSMLPCYSHANQDLGGAYQPATVVSVTKVNTTANYAYDIGFQIGCTLYVVRNKAANDYVAPESLAPKSSVSVMLEKHWLHLSLPPAHDLAMRIVSTGAIDDQCTRIVTANSAQEIPSGTILPVSLNSVIRSDSSAGMAITATVMQDVPLGVGKKLPKGSKVFGQVVEFTLAGRSSDEASVSFQFNQVSLGGRIFPITTNLRAIASVMEVSAARTPKNNGDEPGAWELVQIGGDQVSYGQGPVMIDSQVVGTYTSQGTLAYLSSDLGTECRGTVDGNTSAQAFWVFSAHACGAYGFGDVKIAHSGRNEPVGRITLISGGKLLKIGKSSGMLLRVDGADAHRMSTELPSQAPAALSH